MSSEWRDRWRYRLAAVLIVGLKYTLPEPDKWELRRIPESPADIDMSGFEPQSTDLESE